VTDTYFSGRVTSLHTAKTGAPPNVIHQQNGGNSVAVSGV
jgi:hypothetical protein